MLVSVAVIVSLENRTGNIALKVVVVPPIRLPSGGRTAEGSLLVKWIVPE